LKAHEDIDLTFPGNFNIRTWLKESGNRPSWVPVPLVKEGRKTVPGPEYTALYARIKTAYDIARAVFTKDMTASAVKKVDERHRAVEHMELTSPTVSTKDALAFVWYRNQGKVKNTCFKARHEIEDYGL